MKASFPSFPGKQLASACGIFSPAPAILLLFTIYTQLDDQGHWRFLFHVFFFYVVFIYMLQHSSASSQKHRNSTSSSSCYDVEWAHLLLLLCIPRWDASISDDDVLSLTWTLPKFCAVDVILLNRCRYRRTAKTVVGVGSGSFSRGRLLYRRSFVSTSWYLFVETPKAPFRY